MRSTLGTKWKWALLSLLAAAFVFAPGAAHSQGSEWWRQYKAQCRARGGTICDFYNDCKGVCTMSPPFMTITDSIPFIERRASTRKMEDQTNKFIGELEAVAHHMIHSHMIHNAGLKAIAATAEKALPQFPRPQLPSGEEK